jgi:hypothetical protein
MTMALLPSKRKSARNSDYSPRVQEVIQQMKDDKLYVDSDENTRILNHLTKNLSITEQFYVDCAKFDEAYKNDPVVIKTEKYLRNEAIIAWTFISVFTLMTVSAILGIIWYNNAVKAEASHGGSSVSQEFGKW